MSRLLAVVDGTVRESMAKFTFLAFLVMSTLTLLIITFAVNLDVVDGALAAARLFGKDIQLGGNRIPVDTMVTGIQTGMAGFLFGVGLFLSIFATANLVPVMLEKGYVDLLLSKPLSRPALFLGRYLGALAVVLINLFYLVGGVWVLLGWKTGVWKMGLPAAGLIIVLTYAVILGFMMLVGVLTRSSSITIMLSYFLFPLAGLLAVRDNVTVMLTSKTAVAVIDGLYHVLPKIAGLAEIMGKLAMGKPVDSLAPIGSSVLFGAACLALGAFVFSRRDY
jgi:ABC-type transport system involved in multi-copper enzyme maturation permease subunit